MKALRKILPFLIFLTACASPKALEYRGVEGFRFQSVTLDQSSIGFTVRLFNPNNYALQLKGGNIDVFLNSKLAGKTAVDQRTDVPANAEFLLPLTLNTDMRSLLGSAVSLLLKNEVEIRLQGSIRAGKGGVFVPVPINFVTKQKIDIR